MSSFLAEEISEIESIYCNIKSHLTTLPVPSELVGMIDAVREEINERVEELEWIKRSLNLICLMKRERVFKRFYTETLRDLYAIRHRAIILNQLMINIGTL